MVKFTLVFYKIYWLVFILLILSCKSDKQFVGVISSATPEATNAGEQIFLKGGNAVDAAVAISFALGVTEPAMSGLGGGTQVLLSIKNQEPIAINGTTLSPINTPTNVKDTLTYHRRSTIPSTVKVQDYIWRNYGSGNLSWQELLQPAIDLAENGFTVGPFRAKVYERYEEKLLASNHNTSFFLIDGKIPKLDDVLKQPQLAKTLKRLAEFGADDFYKGEIAKEIAKDMQENGGWITLADLQNFSEPKELKALTTGYKGYRVFTQPPPCGGWTALLALNILAQTDTVDNDAIIEALYLAHNDRVKNPVNDLINYESLIKDKLSENYTAKLLTEDFSNADETEDNSGETTHFSVVDNDGNAIAVTASINAYFGALAASENLGFLYNTYMDDFIFEKPEHPFAIRPNAMAYSSMTPTIVQKDNENVLVIGSPGSSRIISTVAQLTAKWIEKQQLDSLVTAPRIHVSNKNVYLENNKDTTSIDKELLEKYDLKFKTANESLVIIKGLNPYFGGIHAIAKEGNAWLGVADPRRDGKIKIVKN